MKLAVMKRIIMKNFIIFTVCLSLCGGPVAGNEVSKMLEYLSGARNERLHELDLEDEGTEEPKKVIKKSKS